MNDAPDARHRIGAVVRLTGVSAHALRAWERRYGILTPERAVGGGRLYSAADVRKLRLVKQLTEYGHAIGDIARLNEHQLEQLLADHTRAPEPRSDTTAHDTVARYMDALVALDLDTAERLLQRAAISREPRDFIDQVADPMLRAVGERWQTGALCVANEHAASAMLRTQLGTLLAGLPIEPDAPSLVSTTLSGERHEFGALFAAIISALVGWRAVYLGPDLPAGEIVHAARATNARVVLISVVSLTARKARAELDALRGALPNRVRLIVGGNAAAGAMRGLPRVEHSPDLSTLGNMLAVPR